MTSETARRYGRRFLYHCLEHGAAGSSEEFYLSVPPYAHSECYRMVAYCLQQMKVQPMAKIAWVENQGLSKEYQRVRREYLADPRLLTKIEKAENNKKSKIVSDIRQVIKEDDGNEKKKFPAINDNLGGDSELNGSIEVEGKEKTKNAGISDKPDLSAVNAKLSHFIVLLVAGMIVFIASVMGQVSKIYQRSM